MKRYQVVNSYKSEFDNPIILSKNEKVKCIEESDPSGDWPNWTFCKTDSNEGWVPSQIINREGNSGIITEDYSAREFDLSADECIITKRELNGWVWGYKDSNPEDYGWAPLNHLKEI